jgi:UDP-glucose 4-epimerase
MPKNVLVTGGAGYIGSHACVSLLEAGYDVTVVDNRSNSSSESLRRVGEITGRKLEFGRVDLLDSAALDGVFRQKKFDAVLHFAGLKAVGESGEIPLRYYANNVTGTLVLLETMKRHGVKDLVFSSSATVYGEPTKLPLTEDSPLGPTNPYGRTKLMIEDICRDLAAAEKDWRIVLLRYFNPVGAHESGKIGEDPRGTPNNLVPYILQVAVGRLPTLRVFGADWPTPDGTGVRDYIHVMDLVEGHLAALQALPRTQGCVPYNLGTGRGSSVLEMVRAVADASGRRIPYEVVRRRPGDIASCWADPARAEKGLGWRARRGLKEMCADSWRWQSRNPNGYSG